MGREGVGRVGGYRFGSKWRTHAHDKFSCKNEGREGMWDMDGEGNQRDHVRGAHAGAMRPLMHASTMLPPLIYV